MELLFKGERITLKAGIIHLPNKEKTYKEIIYHPGAVVVLPRKNNKVLLIKQYRPPVKEWIIELPAGTLEEKEEPVETAKRELLEETGYYPKKITRLLEFYTSPGISNEKIHAFIASDLIKKKPKREKGELIENMWIPMEKAIELVKNNVIKDAKTIITLLYYQAFINQTFSL